MKVLGFDTETTGVDIKTANVLEIGAVLFDVSEGVWTPGEWSTNLVFHESYLPLPADALAVNGITEDELRKVGIPFSEAISEIAHLVEQADFGIAHNAPFDKGIMDSQLERMQLKHPISELKFLCSLSDIEQFQGLKCRKLSHLALDVGLTVNPKELHRAMDDVLLMGKVLTQVGADPVKMWEFKNEPRAVIAGKVVKPWDDGGKDKDLAVSEGYRWEKIGDKVYPKSWVKLVRKSKLAEEKREYRILEEL